MHLKRYYKKNPHPHAPLNSTEDTKFKWDQQLNLSKEIRELATLRQVLQDKIFKIETRLRFGYSKPLYDYKMQLVKEDVMLSCKMTDFLISLPSHTR